MYIVRPLPPLAYPQLQTPSPPYSQNLDFLGFVTPSLYICSYCDTYISVTAVTLTYLQMLCTNIYVTVVTQIHTC